MMRILGLGSGITKVVRVLSKHELITVDGAITPDWCRELSPDLILSFGYRSMISEEVLREVDGNAVNLHVSLLPWNRGADPNFWSWVEGTPKGVTLHWITSGLDQGPILAQREVELDRRDTLRITYATLIEEITDLFIANWGSIESGSAPSIPQRGVGSIHRHSELLLHQEVLKKGWDTPCEELEIYGLEKSLNIGFMVDE